jgi:hypothetical protein
VSVEELDHLARGAVDATNAAYHTVHGVDDAGTPTTAPHARQLVADLTDGWVAARTALGLQALGGRYGRPKTPLFTRWYEWVGVAGYYFPYTGEANLRAGIPAVDHPKMLAHEMAHQRGVARESEANLWGFLAAAHAPDPVARYSAYAFVQRQLMAALAGADRERWRALLDRRLAGVQRDFSESRAYWQQFQGTGTDVGRAVNHAFLRSNRVTGGVRDYSRSALLMIAYARAHDGRLMPNLAGDSATVYR